MAGNAQAFALQIDRELTEAEEELGTIVAAIAMQAVQRIIMRTPVGNPSLWTSPPPPGYVGGRARGNWFVTIGSENHEATEDKDKEGSETINRATQVVQSYDPAGTWPSIFIQNNLPYIERLENGHSQQAPTGMVAVTKAELEAQFK